MQKGALGIVETYGELAAIEAADQALKAANVELLGCEKVRGGLVNITIVGEVGAVRASVDAAVAAVERLNIQVSSHVIPRPIEDLWKILPNKDTEKEQKKENKKAEKQEVKQEEKEAEDTKDKTNLTFLEEKEKELQEMRVVDLRKLAREVETSISRSEIKFANKKELVTALLDYYKEQGGD
ncbi:BMC domain-containing protein [Urinicoccus timonensis]|uniref:BMC domain-containing protein n=1 Tax=Urinicoccus timonensis TaxID=2024205 RepID=UPI000C069E06|nr:BMC domain-containing protein [Urinicoccus timonensis]